MRGGAPARDRQPLHELAVEARRVAGREVARDEHARLGDALRCRLAGEVPQHAPADVLDVDRPLLQVRVVEAAIGLRERQRGLSPRRLGALARVDRLLRRPEQRRVVEQQHVRIEDPRLALTGLLSDLRPRSDDIPTRRLTSRLEPPPLRKGV